MVNEYVLFINNIQVNTNKNSNIQFNNKIQNFNSILITISTSSNLSAEREKHAGAHEGRVPRGYATRVWGDVGLIKF